jgi:hypothetical protein
MYCAGQSQRRCRHSTRIFVSDDADWIAFAGASVLTVLFPLTHDAVDLRRVHSSSYSSNQSFPRTIESLHRSLLYCHYRISSCGHERSDCEKKTEGKAEKGRFGVARVHFSSTNQILVDRTANACRSSCTVRDIDIRPSRQQTSERTHTHIANRQAARAYISCASTLSHGLRPLMLWSCITILIGLHFFPLYY